uniref:F-box/WD repeat-containing protein 8 n=1 Tax=Leptobrachium leishanense TaxID=445787 RepID=A0A8C5LPW1_9ANUR
MALEESLEDFRSRWRAEIHGSHRGARKRPPPEESPGSRAGCGTGAAWQALSGSPKGDGESGLSRGLELAERLLLQAEPGKGTASSPRKEVPSNPPKRPSLVEQLIEDLNEMNEIPFFDVSLPYEIALHIFQYLGRTELGRCAQVSKMWRVLAEDEVLWHRLCQMEGFLPDSEVTACASWKEALKESRTNANLLRANWKNRSGAVSQLHHELGKVLCDIHVSDGVALAGYTSGDVHLWDTRASDNAASSLKSTRDVADFLPKPQVSFVRINGTLAVAAYENGSVDVWSLLIGREPIHHYQHNQRIQALALCPESAAIATASSFQIKVECPDERGYWMSTCNFQTQKLVNFLHLVKDAGGCPVAIAAADEMVYLLKAEQPEKILHSAYGQPITCLDVSMTQTAFGVKSFGWFANDGSQIHVYNLQTGQSIARLRSSSGDFTCIGLKDSPPHLLVTGNQDRRVRVFDMRCSRSLCSFYAHHLGVSAVRMDDWKVVSGGQEGLTCVWDQRMGTKLWETHARHPVRYVWFNDHSLITANIPDDKNPRGASIMDDDLTAHRRHRGTINVYDFSVDQSSAESVLPICRSSYIEMSGYNYNIGLAVPYDCV